MTVKLLTQHHLEFPSLKEGCTGSSESTLVKMPHCWKSHVTAQLCFPGGKKLSDLVEIGYTMMHIYNIFHNLIKGHTDKVE